jgi:hypothetical protein
MNDDDNQRQLPPPIPDNLISNEFRNRQTRQQKPPRAITAKAAALRAAVRNGNPLDYADLHERLVDLRTEARLAN